MESSDGRLAKVTYLPGVSRPSEPSVPADVAPPVRDASAVAPAGQDADGWYVAESDGTAAGVAAEAAAEASRVHRPVGARPIRTLPTFDDGEDAPDDGTPAAAPVASRASTRAPAGESPAMQKMRALVAAADAARDEEDDEEEVPESREEQAARAENISMSALTRKGMSSWEMADRLRSRDLDEETIEFEVARLERVGLLDDRELANTLVRTLQERKGLGRSGINAELRRRHVDQVAIEEALDASDGDDELARATEVAVKRASQLRSYDDATVKRRLSAFLQRRGYSGSVISGAISAAMTSSSGPRFR
ncbi:regulatory protein RecX [Glaciihabitans sp. dw_435]|uniref:regulatory protein RecX n=1 Tax=Glaciihabitans sp. dw_435 TaxID=2720081 RepID=UPI001BD69AB1|nr:regulatory protein RecX [Glaciihabitans sp. dw_435]